MLELDNPINWEELTHVVIKLTNGKAPGLNKVPPDAFKALITKHLHTIMILFNE